MARTGICGFETGLIAAETAAVQTGWSIDTTAARTGTGSLKIITTSGAVSNSTLPAMSASAKYTRCYIRPDVLPAVARVLFGIPNDNTTWINLDSTGALIFRCNTAPGFPDFNLGISTTLLTDTTRWYRVEFRNLAGLAVAAGDVIGKIDGEDVLAASGFSAGAVTTGAIGSIGPADANAAAYTIHIDDFAEDDATWVGETAILFATPSSDNARGGWTAGAGATTSLFDAVNNIPPAGLAAASETNATQIKSATNSATDNCDLNLPSYLTLGVPSNGTVQAVQALVVHGEEIATGTKTGALKVVSNPAQASEDGFTFGNDAGAVGTSPVNWKPTLGACQSLPTVTLATQPVLRVGKRTATTRLVDVSLMGLYVEYSVPAAAAPPRPIRLARQAVQRAAFY